jgi:hypothetical protein
VNRLIAAVALLAAACSSAPSAPPTPPVSISIWTLLLSGDSVAPAWKQEDVFIRVYLGDPRANDVISATLTYGIAGGGHVVDLGASTPPLQEEVLWTLGDSSHQTLAIHAAAQGMTADDTLRVRVP